MKNSLLKWYMFAFAFLGSFVMFAQEPDSDEGTGGPLEGEDTPINSKLIYLGVVAIIFAYFYFKNNTQRKVNT
jgi:hypothetical protein